MLNEMEFIYFVLLIWELSYFKS